MIKHKKAQAELFMILAFFIIGLIYFIGLAPMVSLIASVSVAENSYTGVWAFFLMNINVFIAIFYVISGLAMGRYVVG